MRTAAGPCRRCTHRGSWGRSCSGVAAAFVLERGGGCVRVWMNGCKSVYACVHVCTHIDTRVYTHLHHIRSARAEALSIHVSGIHASGCGEGGCGRDGGPSASEWPLNLLQFISCLFVSQYVTIYQSVVWLLVCYNFSLRVGVASSLFAPG